MHMSSWAIVSRMKQSRSPARRSASCKYLRHSRLRLLRRNATIRLPAPFPCGGGVQRCRTNQSTTAYSAGVSPVGR